jgi:hypothetical protein
MGEKHCRRILLTKHNFHARKVLLHAVNLRHGTDDFASPPKEVVLRILEWDGIMYRVLIRICLVKR